MEIPKHIDALFNQVVRDQANIFDEMNEALVSEYNPKFQNTALKMMIVDYIEKVNYLEKTKKVHDPFKPVSIPLHKLGLLLMMSCKWLDSHQKLVEAGLCDSETM